MSTSTGTYDAHRDHYRYLADSYWGGERYRTPSATTIGRAQITTWVQRRDENGRYLDEWDARVIGTYGTYLVPHPGEAPDAFRARMALAGYVNVIQPIVDSYVDASTADVTRVLGSLGPYVESLDGQGRQWGELVEEVARWAAVYGWCACVIEPPTENTAQTRAEEIARGTGLRAAVVHPPAVAWVEVDRDGGVQELAFVDQPYLARESSNGVQVVQLYRYTPGMWERHEVKLADGAALTSLRAEVAPGTLRASGSTRTAGVPVVFAYFRRDTSTPMPQGISLVADAADLARQIYNSMSWIHEIHAATAFPFLAVPEPAAGGALDPGTARKIGPRHAFGYQSTAGAPQWVQPSADSTRELRDHVAFLMAAALRTTGLEVTAGDGPADASGTALKIRSRDFEARCKRFAEGLRRFEIRALRIAAEIMGMAEPAPPVYPRRYTLPEPSADLARAALVIQAIGDTLGGEGRAEVARAVLDAGLDLSDDRVRELVDEIRAVLPTQPDTTAAPEDAAPVSDAAPVEDVQATALNGAQVEAMVSIVQKVAIGEIPRESGLSLLQLAFQLGSAEAAAVMGSAGAGFTPAATSLPAQPTDAAPADTTEGVDNGDS